MMRPLVLTVGFVVSTLALLWMLNTSTSDAPAVDQVSRTSPDPMGLQPAVAPLAQPTAAPVAIVSQSQVAPAAPSPVLTPPATAVPTGFAPTRPQARPQGLLDQGSVDESLAPTAAAPNRVRALLGEPAPSATATPARTATATPPATAREVAPRADDTLNALGYRLVEELKKPVQPAQETPQRTASLSGEPQALPQAVVRSPAQTSQPTVAPALRSYTVQPGDSLPGIAFRFYGTTVGYLQILAANEDILTSPASLRAGMTLRIPDQ